ncbi:hypothetical protein BDV19DRAFT_201179 [Aspergillus venezuelensis]
MDRCFRRFDSAHGCSRGRGRGHTLVLDLQLRAATASLKMDAGVNKTGACCCFPHGFFLVFSWILIFVCIASFILHFAFLRAAPEALFFCFYFYSFTYTTSHLQASLSVTCTHDSAPQTRMTIAGFIVGVRSGLSFLGLGLFLDLTLV